MSMILAAERVSVSLAVDPVFTSICICWLIGRVREDMNGWCFDLWNSNRLTFLK